MTLGFVIGESKPTLVTAQTSRSLPIGEYVIIDSQDGKIVGLAEKSVVSSAALGDVKNYDEAKGAWKNSRSLTLHQKGDLGGELPNPQTLQEKIERAKKLIQQSY